MAVISFKELHKAVLSLKEAYEASLKKGLSSQEQKIYKDACIQRYEYSIELSWKMSKKFMGSNMTASRPVIREMAQNNLITNPQLWFTFIDARNNTSHAYDEAIAEKVYECIPVFINEVDKRVCPKSS